MTKPNSIMSATTIAPDDLKEKLDAGEPMLVLDVREPEEFEGWNVPGSVNVPLDRVLAGQYSPLSGKPVVTVCAHGARSELARQSLAQTGVRARSLEGGMVAWNSIYEAAEVTGASRAVVHQIRRIGKGCLSYVIESQGEAAVIDPSSNVQEYVGFAASRGVRITKVIDTHAHADHVSGSRLLVEETGATYHAPAEVGPNVAHVDVREGEGIRVGDVELRPLATPGHTPGSTTYLLDSFAFTGDSLFVESVGRPDLGQDPRPNASVLHDTLHGKLMMLPPETIVLPGHYGEGVTRKSGESIQATLAQLKDRLPALELDKPAFVEWVASNALPKPANFETIKKINQGLIPLGDPDDLGDLEAGANRCAVSG